MKVTIYETQGERKVALGVVTYRRGVVEFDDVLIPLFRNILHDPETGKAVTPTDGKAFLEALPRIFTAAPYLWAEAS